MRERVNDIDKALTKMTTLIFDIETNGLLKKLTRIHTLVIRDADTRKTSVFRKRDANPALEMYPVTRPGELFAVEAEDTIPDGTAMLSAADVIVGHNIVAFDIPAIRKLFPSFTVKTHRDTLVLTRVIMPDTKDTDFPLWKRGVLPGKLIGKHSLDAWGYRTGARKGDYSEEMEKLGKDPWASWNQDLEDYNVVDVDVTEILLAACNGSMPPEACVQDEHEIHDLCAALERNGFPFDVNGGLKLQERLESEYEKVAADAKAAFGPWYAPEKKVRVNIEWDDPDGANRAKYVEDMYCLDNGGVPSKRQKYHRPREQYGEDMSRNWWAEVSVPKRTMKFRSKVDAALCGINKTTGTIDTHSLRMEGAPYCRIEKRDFNPGSRDQVIDRFEQVYGWVPNQHEFTENGTPEVNDAVLRAIADPKKTPQHKLIPIADKIAECFFIKKYLGQVATGRESWLKRYDPDTGCIHCYINVGGTVSGRCSHIGPNLGQVPSCVEAKTRIIDKQTKEFKGFNPNLVLGNGMLMPHCFDWDGREKEEAPLLGREGEFGWECRSLFGVPQGWVQVGVDLSGIEFRCLAELMREFDDGELIEVIKSGQDIHVFNMQKTGIARRDVIKRCLYGLMYGAGDYKLGITADESLTSDETAAAALGKQIRGQIMAGLPALDKAIRKVQAEAQYGHIIGLDGRKLGCRQVYSALNLRLQSNAALIAKKWLVTTERNALKQGWDHGWFSDNNSDGNGDFAMMAFVHDEQQSAVRPELRLEFGQVATDAALEVGKHFKFVCPIEAKAKYGHNWAECH